MPPNQAQPCPVCAKQTRTDHMVRHLYNSHRHQLTSIMKEDCLRWCKENKRPFFYDKLDAKTFKFACCLVCKEGRTFYGRDDVGLWITQHQKTSCMADFDTVCGCFGLPPPTETTTSSTVTSLPYIEPTLVVSKEILAKVCASFAIDKEIAMRGVDAVLNSVLNIRMFQQKRERAAAAKPVAVNEIVLQQTQQTTPPERPGVIEPMEAKRTFVDKKGDAFFKSLLLRIDRIQDEGEELTPHDVGREYYDDDLEIEDWLARNKNEPLSALFGRYKQYLEEDCSVEDLVLCASRTLA